MGIPVYSAVFTNNIVYSFFYRQPTMRASSRASTGVAHPCTAEILYNQKQERFTTMRERACESQSCCRRSSEFSKASMLLLLIFQAIRLRWQPIAVCSVCEASLCIPDLFTTAQLPYTMQAAGAESVWLPSDGFHCFFRFFVTACPVIRAFLPNSSPSRDKE